MKVEHDLVLDVIVDAENSGEVLHILTIILEHAVMVAFDAEGQAKIDLIQIQSFLVVEVVLLVDGDDVRVVLAEEVDDLDRPVNEHDYHDEEGRDAARDRVDHGLTLEVESGQRRTKNIDPLQQALQVEVLQVPCLDLTIFLKIMYHFIINNH